MDGRKISDKQWDELLERARAGSRRAFLTSGGGTRYGAAVMTASGAIYEAGQYSSFNHITNIHAEMAAVLMATMQGDPDVVALALVSTSSITECARVCGVCREFLNEHSQRIGHDIVVCMSNYAGTKREMFNIGQMLPAAWVAAKGSKKERQYPWTVADPYTAGEALRTGDMVQMRGGYLALVWDACLQAGTVLVKVKYKNTAAPVEGRMMEKLPHSFTEYGEYMRALEAEGLRAVLPWGQPGSAIEERDIEGVVRMLPLHGVGLSRLQGFVECLTECRIPLRAAQVTTSWAAAVATPGSDIDMCVRVEPGEIRALRAAITERIAAGVFSLPKESGTLRYLERTMGQTGMQLALQHRYCETFVIGGEAGGTRCSLMYDRPQMPGAAVPGGAGNWQMVEVSGTVIDAREAAYKRGVYVIRRDGGEEVRCVCWHKMAGLLAEGDRVRVAGWMCEAGEERWLFQLSAQADYIKCEGACME